MKPIYHHFICIALAGLSLFGCSTSTTSTVADDEEFYSYGSSTDAVSSSSIVASSSSTAVSSSAEDKNARIYDAIDESGKYTARDSVAAYICKFDKLPQNYVNKAEGQKLYESSTGNAFSKWNFNPWETLGVMIGGDRFNNLIGAGDFYEADVDYGNAKNRGTKRLIYQSGCIIYYTEDHYVTFNPLEIR